jgi:PAS domain S-box-containing protein
MAPLEGGLRVKRLLRALGLVLLPAAVALSPAVWISYSLYQDALHDHELRLVYALIHESAKMETTLRSLQDDRDLALELISESHAKRRRSDASEQIQLVRRQGDEIVLPLSGQALPLSEPNAEAMRRALEGEAGTLFGPSHLGEPSLSAYRPLALGGWGAVATTPLATIRQPFVDAWASGAAIVAVGIALAALARGAGGSRRRPASQGAGQPESWSLSVLEACPDGVVSIDSDGTIQTFNSAAERLFGYTRDEVVGRSVDVLMPESESDQRAAGLSAFRAATRPETLGARRQVTARRRDGTTFGIELAVVESLVAGSPIFTALMREVVEGRRADERLEELARIPNESPEPVFRALGDGTLLYANAACAPLLAEWNTRVGEKLPQDWQDLIRDALESEGTPEIEHRVGARVLSLRCVVVPRAGYVNVYGNDVTKAKEVAAELQRAKESAEAGSRLKTEFLANMSHEIRTPMMAILGYTDLLRETNQDPTERDQSLRIIQRNGEHLLAVINDILDLSKIEAGHMVVETVHFNPFTVVMEAASLVRPRARDKGITFQVMSQGEIPATIQSDPVRLRQILINLLGNAIKFTQRGGVRLLVKMATDPEDPNPILRFDVVDTGIGMSEAESAKLFQPFTQADSSTTRKFGGTGLGLAISRRLSVRLGGDIRVKSRPGQGSVFSLTIATGPLDRSQMVVHPDTDLDEVERAEAEAERELRLRGGRILLAEDGLDNQRLITTVLQREGLEVDIAENGRIAVHKAMLAWRAEQPYDVILMDMQMPELDGYGATARLRESGYTAPIVALTAHAMSGDREKCLSAGCNDFASKPIDRRRLIQMIGYFVQKKDTE